MKRQFLKEKVQMANKHIKMFSSSLATKKIEFNYIGIPFNSSQNGSH